VLKSDQNGIEINLIIKQNNNLVLLKSDQNGIEIVFIYHSLFFHLKLKSDQNGIEIYGYEEQVGFWKNVKIRPKWD